MKAGTIWNKIVKGIGWFFIQLFAVIECYVLSFMCTSVISTVMLTVMYYIPVCAKWTQWVFSHYGMLSLLASIPITIVLFIYLLISLYKKPKTVHMDVSKLSVQNMEQKQVKDVK